MAQSREYPDLPWVASRSWKNANRVSVQLIIIHTTEGHARPSAAEDGAAYDARRTDGTSTHFFHDSDSTVQCVHTADIAHAAHREGNRRGIHHELCTKAATTAEGWANPYHTAMLRRAARQVARDCRKWGIPVRQLSVAAVKDGQRGICGHHDVSLAFGQSTHTDPGKNFPWTEFIKLVRAEMAPPPPKEPNMALSSEDMESIATRVWVRDVSPTAADNKAWTTLWTAHQSAQSADAKLSTALERISALETQVAAILAAVTKEQPPPAV